MWLPKKIQIIWRAIPSFNFFLLLIFLCFPTQSHRQTLPLYIYIEIEKNGHRGEVQQVSGRWRGVFPRGPDVIMYTVQYAKKPLVQNWTDLLNGSMKQTAHPDLVPFKEPYIPSLIVVSILCMSSFISAVLVFLRAFILHLGSCTLILLWCKWL